jgi:hypothetical protein
VFFARKFESLAFNTSSFAFKSTTMTFLILYD